MSAFPGGLRPERFDAEGNQIDHAIEVDPDAVPFKRSHRPFTAEEAAEIQQHLQDFLAKGWVVPYLSPWAARVLFVPKKVDPVTGKRTWRMCISFVKLNSKTLNRIAYRLPRISDLLDRINGARCFSKLDLLDAGAGGEERRCYNCNQPGSKLHEAVAVDVAAAGAGGAEGQWLLPSVRLMCNIWWIVSQVSPQPFFLISGR